MDKAAGWSDGDIAITTGMNDENQDSFTVEESAPDNVKPLLSFSEHASDKEDEEPLFEGSEDDKSGNKSSKKQ